MSNFFSKRSAYLNRKLNVNNQGWIMLTDYMGSDHSIAQCARTSYGKGTKTRSDDEHLIRYMFRHGHTSPFEQAEVQFLVYVPMDIWRQWVRHRTASINEYSTRYSVAINQMYEATEWRKQSNSNRQGSEGVLPEADAELLSESEEKFHQLARDLYNERIELGVAREQARKDLPLSTFTQAYWKIDLHNCLHFLSLRLEDHAQKEIREYAHRIAEVISNLFPMTWQAFLDYEITAERFSGIDMRVGAFYFAKRVIEALKFCNPKTDYSSLERHVERKLDKFMPEDWKKERSRERDEFYKKIEKLMPPFVWDEEG